MVMVVVNGIVEPLGGLAVRDAVMAGTVTVVLPIQLVDVSAIHVTQALILYVPAITPQSKVLSLIIHPELTPLPLPQSY